MVLLRCFPVNSRKEKETPVWRSSLQNRLSLLVCVSNAAHGVLMVNPR